MTYITVSVYNMTFRESDGAIIGEVQGFEEPLDLEIEVDDKNDDSEIRVAIETAVDDMLDEQYGFGEIELIDFEYSKY